MSSGIFQRKRLSCTNGLHVARFVSYGAEGTLTDVDVPQFGDRLSKPKGNGLRLRMRSKVNLFKEPPIEHALRLCRFSLPGSKSLGNRGLCCVEVSG